jgi:hypothetical protein
MRKANTNPCTPRRSLRWSRVLPFAALLLAYGAFATPPQAPSATPAQTPPAAPIPAEKPAEPLAKADEQVRPWPLPADRNTPLPDRRPDAARLHQLQDDPAFHYQEVAPESLGLWDRFWYWIASLFSRLFSTRGGQLTWKYGWYAAIVAALVFAVLKLLKVDLTGAFGRSRRHSGLAYDVLDEDIHAIDFPARLAEAEAAGNYRLAVRLGYLEALKHLSDAGLLQWEPNKTNHVYLHELPAGPLREAFRVATRQFEYVWYGELLLTAAQYGPVREAQRAVRTATSSTAFTAAR